MLLTQNVDRLHQAAGSRAVIDLHGRLDLDRPMARLATSRRAWSASTPPGSACASCGGVLKPDVVFFGETVPRDQVAAAQLADCSAGLKIAENRVNFGEELQHTRTTEGANG